MTIEGIGLGRRARAEITIPEGRRGALSAGKRRDFEEVGKIHGLIKKPRTFFTGIEKEITGDLKFGTTKEG